MINIIKKYWLPVVVLFVIFFDELFNCSAVVRGFIVDTGMKQYEAMMLAAIGYSMLGYDLLKGGIKKRDHRTLVVLFALFFLYMLTPLFYGEAQDKHTTYLLLYGSECIPAAYVGIRFAKSRDLHRINDILPFIVIPVSLMIGAVGLTAAMMGTTVGGVGMEDVENGLNYQILSYYMAFSYTYAFYYVFYGNRNSGLVSGLLKFVMAVDMLFCATICLMGGGRGAFVYIVAITLFMLLYYLKASKKRMGHAVVVIVSLLIVSLYIVSSLGVMQSTGMERVTSKLTEDGDRLDLYMAAFNAFLTSPIIGRGVGSIWWTVGFYCHNAILDLLAETGLIGTLFLLSIVWRTFLRLYILSIRDKIFLLFFLVMAGEFVSCMFSGYYIAAFKIYFVCSLTYCLPTRNIDKHKNEDSATR